MDKEKNKDHLHPTNTKFKRLGRTNLSCSICGFGSYRVDQGVTQHKSALEFALNNGINLIDSSANYSDGGSETLAGEVISNLMQLKQIQRSELIIVTKGGYIQGENLKLAAQKENSGRAYKEVVKCTPDLWHCIHPKFLEDQITASLKKLKQKHIDVYLLHNPEYFLTYSTIPDEKERNEAYYIRIKNAFIYLEKEVEKGRIHYYGISSNTFGEKSSALNFTSLEKILQAANDISIDHHFTVIQLPLNIIERGAVVNKNQKNNTKTVLELASENNLGILVNRPLNAIVNNKLIRLSDFNVKENRTKEEIKALINDLSVQEDLLRNEFVDKTEFASSERRSMYDCLSLATIITHNYDKFESPNHFQEIKGYYLIPRANYAISELIAKRTNDEDLIKAVKQYALTINILLDSVESDLALKHNEKNKLLHEEIDKYLNSEQRKLTLSQKAILMINSLYAVSCTLVGMRRTEYVKDVLGSVNSDYVPNAEQFWFSKSNQQTQL